MRRKLIRVERAGGTARVFLDGEELDGIPRETDVTVEVNPGLKPTVRLTLMAERVEVVDSLGPEPEEHTWVG